MLVGLEDRVLIFEEVFSTCRFVGKLELNELELKLFRRIFKFSRVKISSYLGDQS